MKIAVFGMHFSCVMRVGVHMLIRIWKQEDWRDGAAYLVLFLAVSKWTGPGAMSLLCRECITKVEMTKDSTSSKQQLSVVMTCDFILHWNKTKTIGSFQENNKMFVFQTLLCVLCARQCSRLTSWWEHHSRKLENVKWKIPMFWDWIWP